MVVVMLRAFQLLRSQDGCEALAPARPVVCRSEDHVRQLARELLVEVLIRARQRAGANAPMAVRVLRDRHEIFRWTYQDEADAPERRTS
jgi:hypothetical protein